MPLWLPESLHNNSSTLFPLGKFNIHRTKLDQELKQVCLDGQAVVSWTLGYQGLVVMWSGHRGKVADGISLSMFSPSRSESGQTVRWKNRAQEG